VDFCGYSGNPINTNKTDCHDIVETLLKVGLNNITQTKPNALTTFKHPHGIRGGIQ
jgi:hypothetical protein